MAFTRFNYDDARIIKSLQQSTGTGRYYLNTPGPGNNTAFIDDPQIRMQKWGANLSKNKTQLENDLLGITRKLNTDSIKENNYLNSLT